MAVRYVIFDLDDTLVHSDAVRRAFCDVAALRGIDAAAVNAVCDAKPGQPALNIFEALGYGLDEAADAAVAFLARLEELNGELPTVPYADADATLRAVLEQGADLILSTGSPDERARRVLDETGWDGFALVLGSGPTCRKGADHFCVMDEQIDAPRWIGDSATVGDSPADMRIAAEAGVPVRIAVARSRDAGTLRAAGATHVVSELSEIVPILAAA